MWRLTIIVLTLALLLPIFSPAQQYLLFMKNRRQHVLYEKGDIITFQLKGNKQKITLPIVGFEDGQIMFKGFSLDPSEISLLYRDNTNKNLWFLKYKYEKLFLTGGIGYLLLDTFNHGTPDENTLLVSGSLIGAGLLMKGIVGQRIPIRGKRKLRVIKL